jgi:hypothetical protein
MKIRGEIFKKRFYPYHEYENINCICFLKIDDSIEIGKDRIKVIPILSEESTVSNNIGKFIEVDGEIEWRQIITPLCRWSFLPTPILRLRNIKRVHSKQIS